MSYFSDHLAWQQRVGQEANALARYLYYKAHSQYRHYDKMLDKQAMDGSLPFNEGSALLPAAVGIGYLKQPLRYLTGEDIRTMGSRTMSSFKPNMTSKGEMIDYGGNNLNFVGIPRVSMHGSSKNTWGKWSQLIFQKRTPNPVCLIKDFIFYTKTQLTRMCV